MKKKKKSVLEAVEVDEKLTIKQKRFIKYYLEDPSNASEAARKAGYSPKCASEQAYQLLRKTSLLPHLQRAAASGEYDVSLTVDDIIGKIEGMAEVNIFDFIEIVNGRAILMKSMSEIPYEYGQYIKSIKETSNGLELTFYEKTKAYEMLLKAKGGVTEKTNGFELAYKI